jgi:hypothetical protein
MPALKRAMGAHTLGDIVGETLLLLLLKSLLLS